MRRILTIIPMILLPLLVFSQNTDRDIEQIIENITDYMSEDDEGQSIDIDILYDDLTYFYTNKINLNTATKEQLQRLQFLSDIQIENILRYVYTANQMQTIYELQLIDGLDYFALQLLLPFVCVQTTTADANKWIVKDVFSRIKHEIFARTDGTVERKKGYIEKKYFGEPFYGQLRYNLKASNLLQAGLTAEKDAGEQFWGKHNKGFDSYTAYIQADKLWKFERIVVGDFRATFGQGLIMNGAFNAGKSSYVLKVTPSQSGLVRKSSSDEYNFFRGVGATVCINNINITAMYSLRYLDALIDSTNNSFSSINTSGLFRTEGDWKRRNNVSVQAIAANINYRIGSLKLGLTLYDGRLSKPLIPKDVPYTLYSFRGQRQSAAAIDYYWSPGKFTIFGETSITDRSAIATVNGVALTPVSTISLVVLHRYYSPSYDLLFAKAFGKSTHVSNENGIYMGAEINPVRKLKISAYGDVFSHPYLTYNASAPTKGLDAMLQLDFTPTRKLSMYLRGKHGDSERNFKDNSQPTYMIANYRRQSIRYNLSYKMRQLSLRTIAEVNFAKAPQSSVTNGIALVQDIGYNTDWHNLTIKLHYVFFNAREFANRLYFYEHDVPYSMFTPMLYGVGNRYCINVQMEPLRSLSVYLRFAQTIYTDKRNSIGSGLESIQGNVKTDFKIAVKWRFITR